MTDVLKAVQDEFLFWIWLGIFTVLAVYTLYELARSNNLLRRFHEGERRGSFFAVKWTLLESYFYSIDILDLRSWVGRNLYDTVRKRTEHEIFYPRADTKNAEEWRRSLSRALDAKNPQISVKTPKHVQSAEDKIRNYFDIVNEPLGARDLIGSILLFSALSVAGYYVTSYSLHDAPADWAQYAALAQYIDTILFACLAILLLLAVALLFNGIKLSLKRDNKHEKYKNDKKDKDEEDEDDGEDDDNEEEDKRIRQFLTRIEIDDGFIAPLHLIAGLLNRVDEEWGKIINVYNYDVDPSNNTCRLGVEASSALEQLRTFQKFTFDCWLLWGPSIPICDDNCRQHRSSVSSIQLGYGDENSSIEIIGDHAMIRDKISDLASCRLGGELAVNVTARGWIGHSKLYPKKHISSSIRKSWKNDKNGRILLLMKPPSGKSGEKEEPPNEIVPSSHSSFYYTAYLWVCFVIMEKKGEEWLPINASASTGRTSKEPWLDFIPFFEHGNIADGPTYGMLKWQLARKALSGLSRLVREWRDNNENKPYPLKFVYACAIDDSGCGNDLKFTDKDYMGEVKDILAEMLPDYPELIADAMSKHNAIVELNLYTKGNPHSSCLMPKAVRRFYRHIDKVERKSQ